MLELIIRLVVSLAIVVGLLILTIRLGQRSMRGRSGALVRVVQRQALTRSSGVAVVEVAGRYLVLGTTEHQVNVLAELDDLDGYDDAGRSRPTPVIDLAAARAEHALPAGPTPAQPDFAEQLAEELAAPVEPVERRTGGAHAAPRPRRTPARPSSPTSSPLAGSVLSPDTWRQALSAATGRTR